MFTEDTFTITKGTLNLDQILSDANAVRAEIIHTPDDVLIHLYEAEKQGTLACTTLSITGRHLVVYFAVWECKDERKVADWVGTFKADRPICVENIAADLERRGLLH